MLLEPWGAYDEVAGEVAMGFYRNVFRQLSRDRESPLRVAEVLHEAVVEYKAGV